MSNKRHTKNPKAGDGRASFNEPTAASLLGIAKHALRDLRLSRRVVGCRLGRHVVYERVELERLLWESRLH